MVKDAAMVQHVLQHILFGAYALVAGTYQQRMNLKNCSLRSVAQILRGQNLKPHIAGVMAEMEQMITGLELFLKDVQIAG